MIQYETSLFNGSLAIEKRKEVAGS